MLTQSCRQQLVRSWIALFRKVPVHRLGSFANSLHRDRGRLDSDADLVRKPMVRLLADFGHIDPNAMDAIGEALADPDALGVIADAALIALGRVSSDDERWNQKFFR
jgi:hypothetical protein